MILGMDLGTENSTIAVVQRILRHSGGDSFQRLAIKVIAMESLLLIRY